MKNNNRFLLAGMIGLVLAFGFILGGCATTKLVIKDGVTAIKDNQYSRQNLVTVVIPKGVTSIGKKAFSENKLTEVIIPEGVTTIGDQAFAFNNLTTVNIPESVTELGTYAFDPDVILTGNKSFARDKKDDSVVAIRMASDYGWRRYSRRITFDGGERYDIKESGEGLYVKAGEHKIEISLNYGNMNGDTMRGTFPISYNFIPGQSYEIETGVQGGLFWKMFVYIKPNKQTGKYWKVTLETGLEEYGSLVYTERGSRGSYKEVRE